MKGLWWKLLGVLILLYVFIVGMGMPLKPGIVEVSPRRAMAGEEIKLQVTGYNTHFSAEGDLRAWLKTDQDTPEGKKSFLLAAGHTDILDDRRAELTFNLPPLMPTPVQVVDFTLVLDHPVDGSSVLPTALLVSQDSINAQAGRAAWPQSELTDLHEHGGMSFPFRNILAESIRNTYFHVPLWFAMLILFLASVVYGIRYLIRGEAESDRRSLAFARVGLLYGLLGLVTGAVWANYTWGAPWSFDVKQNMTAVALLIYMAYFILRSSFEDDEKRARISGVYNIFAFSTLIPLLYVVPRLSDSLHPGAGGNPAFGGEDLDNTMRMVFYPAIIGWTLLGVWLATLVGRIDRIQASENDISDTVEIL